MLPVDSARRVRIPLERRSTTAICAPVRSGVHAHLRTGALQLRCEEVAAATKPMAADPVRPHNRQSMTTRPTRIQVCGHLVVEIEGERIEGALPGRQGRLLLAYLILHRDRPVRRDELVEALWTEGAPPPSADALAPPLS